MSAHVRKSDLRGCVEISAEFIAAMLPWSPAPNAPPLKPVKSVPTKQRKKK